MRIPLAIIVLGSVAGCASPEYLCMQPEQRTTISVYAGKYKRVSFKGKDYLVIPYSTGAKDSLAMVPAADCLKWEGWEG